MRLSVIGLKNSLTALCGVADTEAEKLVGGRNPPSRYIQLVPSFRDCNLREGLLEHFLCRLNLR